MTSADCRGALPPVTTTSTLTNARRTRQVAHGWDHALLLDDSARRMAHVLFLDESAGRHSPIDGIVPLPSCSSSPLAASQNSRHRTFLLGRFPASPPFHWRLRGPGLMSVHRFREIAPSRRATACATDTLSGRHRCRYLMISDKKR